MTAGRIIALALVLAALAVSGPASAAVTVTVGRADLASGNPAAAATAGGGSVPAWLTLTQSATATPGAVAAVPAEGRLTAWRVRGTRTGRGQVALLVLRPRPGGTFVSIARLIAGDVAGADNPASVDVEPGDRLAVNVYCGDGADLSAGYAAVDAVPSAGSSLSTLNLFGTPGPQEGTAFPGATDSELLLNATVELALPELTGISAARGPSAGGTSVVLTGRRLAGVTGVTFDGVPASFTKDGTSVVAVSPPHAAGPVPVVVTAAGGPSNPVTFTYDAPPDTTAPAVSLVRVAPSRFRAARSGGGLAARRPPVGTRVSFALSEPATVTFGVERAAPPKKGKRGPTRWKALAGTLKRSFQSGGSTVRFTGRLAGRALRPGAYRLTLVARDDAGNASPAKRIAFRIVR